MFIGLVHCEGQIEAKLHACCKAWYYGETSSSKKMNVDKSIHETIHELVL